MQRLAPSDPELIKIPAGDRKIPDPIIVPTTREIPPKIPTFESSPCVSAKKSVVNFQNLTCHLTSC